MSFTIDPWMMRDLDLSGNELIIFALVCEAGEKGLSVSKPKLASSATHRSRPSGVF